MALITLNLSDVVSEPMRHKMGRDPNLFGKTVSGWFIYNVIKYTIPGRSDAYKSLAHLTIKREQCQIIVCSSSKLRPLLKNQFWRLSPKRGNKIIFSVKSFACDLSPRSLHPQDKLLHCRLTYWKLNLWNIHPPPPVVDMTTFRNLFRATNDYKVLLIL